MSAFSYSHSIFIFIVDLHDTLLFATVTFRISKKYLIIRVFFQNLLLSCEWYIFVFVYTVTGHILLTWYDLYCQVIPSSCIDNYYLVDALESHISEVDENQLVLYAQMANLVDLILPSVELDLKEIAHTFSKFACNAHTICDSELRPLGTGLYPVISIINHSCVPNAVLTFDDRTAYVRALQPIGKDEEFR